MAQLEAYAYEVRQARAYEDAHWRGSAPRLLVRASAEPGPALELAAPGWDEDDLRELCGRSVLATVYVPRAPAPPAAGAPCELGRLLFLCE